MRFSEGIDRVFRLGGLLCLYRHSFRIICIWFGLPGIFTNMHKSNLLLHFKQHFHHSNCFQFKNPCKKTTTKKQCSYLIKAIAHCGPAKKNLCVSFNITELLQYHWIITIILQLLLKQTNVWSSVQSAISRGANLRQSCSYIFFPLNENRLEKQLNRYQRIFFPLSRPWTEIIYCSMLYYLIWEWK